MREKVRIAEARVIDAARDFRMAFKSNTDIYRAALALIEFLEHLELVQKQKSLEIPSIEA